jgi:hypothetical protein
VVVGEHEGKETYQEEAYRLRRVGTGAGREGVRSRRRDERSRGRVMTREEEREKIKEFDKEAWERS